MPLKISPDADIYEHMLIINILRSVPGVKEGRGYPEVPHRDFNGRGQRFGLKFVARRIEDPHDRQFLLFSLFSSLSTHWEGNT